MDVRGSTSMFGVLHGPRSVGQNAQHWSEPMAVARFTIVNIGFLSMNKYWGETERVREGTATCTLIESGGLRLIVDPSPYPDVLCERLFATTSLRPEAIDLVFVTHWHGDHRYGLELFPGKPRLASAEGLADWRARAPQD